MGKRKSKRKISKNEKKMGRLNTFILLSMALIGAALVFYAASNL